MPLPFVPPSLSRREALRTFGLAALGSVALAACGGSAAATVTSSAAAIAPATPQATSASASSSAAPTTTTAPMSTTSAATVATTTSASPTVVATSAATSSSAASTTSNAASAATSTSSALVVTRQAGDILYFAEFSGDQMKVIDTLIGPFQQAHAGTKVEVIAVYASGVEEMQKLTTLVVSGTPPDLIKWTGAASSMSQNGFTTALDAYVARDKFDLGQYPHTLLQDAGYYQGKLQALPMAYGGNGVAMVYNRTLFQHAGLAEPPTKWGDASWTWDAMVAAAQKLNKVNGNTFSQVGLLQPGYYMDLPQLWQASWTSSDLKTITCDSPSMIDCYTRYGDLSAKYHIAPMSTDKAPDKGFLSGAVGMATIGGWEFTSYAKASSLDFGFAPFPKVTVSVPQIDATILQLGTGKNVDGGWSLMQYLIDGSRQALFENRVPLTPDAITKWAGGVFSGRDVRVPVLVDAVAAAVSDEPILFVKNWTTMNKAIDPVMTNLQDGKVTAQTALSGLKPTLQALL
jgi:ABC-type glycerol-3-phosphate transport system substrate-binding protein